ncbi:MAG: PEP-utilizing enzyme [Patescibacteria group bacterium]|nr:PEP-utilizing enzyme [Patescibacteria group bacterium]
MDQAKLYQTQISLTEWFLGIEHQETEAMRAEDNEKRERLKVLHEIIGIPIEVITQFKAIELVEKSERFEKFLKEHGEELCALRLIPLDQNLPKLRMRGLSIKKAATEWFFEQKIDPQKYKADFMPHSEKYVWSTIFVVNEHGVFGEITKGGHFQLTQGFHEGFSPIVFSFDFKKWHFSREDLEAEKAIKKIVDIITVKDKKKKEILQEKFNSEFAQNVLQGYFETVEVEEFGLWFVDYNRILGKMYDNFIFETKSIKTETKELSGMTASPGQATGKVKIISRETITEATIEEDEILVCDMTIPDCLFLMKKALAIVTDKGGILSHAAIISRELGKPCISATKVATTVLKNGDLVKVDADRGIVEIIKPK